MLLCCLPQKFLLPTGLLSLLLNPRTLLWMTSGAAARAQRRRCRYRGAAAAAGGQRPPRNSGCGRALPAGSRLLPGLGSGIRHRIPRVPPENALLPSAGGLRGGPAARGGSDRAQGGGGPAARGGVGPAQVGWPPCPGEAGARVSPSCTRCKVLREAVAPCLALQCASRGLERPPKDPISPGGKQAAV